MCFEKPVGPNCKPRSGNRHPQWRPWQVCKRRRLPSGRKPISVRGQRPPTAIPGCWSGRGEAQSVIRLLLLFKPGCCYRAAAAAAAAAAAGGHIAWNSLTRRRLLARANLETEQLFKGRVQGSGWTVPSPKQEV